jgi:hypothetical protein
MASDKTYSVVKVNTEIYSHNLKPITGMYFGIKYV